MTIIILTPICFYGKPLTIAVFFAFVSLATAAEIYSETIEKDLERTAEIFMPENSTKAYKKT